MVFTPRDKEKFVSYSFPEFILNCQPLNMCLILLFRTCNHKYSQWWEWHSSGDSHHVY